MLNSLGVDVEWLWRCALTEWCLLIRLLNAYNFIDLNISSLIVLPHAVYSFLMIEIEVILKSNPPPLCNNIIPTLKQIDPILITTLSPMIFLHLFLIAVFVTHKRYYK